MKRTIPSPDLSDSKLSPEPHRGGLGHGCMLGLAVLLVGALAFSCASLLGMGAPGEPVDVLVDPAEIPEPMPADLIPTPLAVHDGAGQDTGRRYVIAHSTDLPPGIGVPLAPPSSADETSTAYWGRVIGTAGGVLPVGPWTPFLQMGGPVLAWFAARTAASKRSRDHAATAAKQGAKALGAMVSGKAAKAARATKAAVVAIGGADGWAHSDTVQRLAASVSPIAVPTTPTKG